MKVSIINFNSYIANKNCPVLNSINNTNVFSFGNRKYDFFERAINEEEHIKYENRMKKNKANTETNLGSVNNEYVAVSQNTNLANGLEMAGLVGIPLILSIALASAIARGTESPEDIFLPDGTYFCNARDLAVKSSKLEADGNDGILKIKGTGIQIDKSRYDEDLSDPTKGVFKSADGNLDIDLINNKYIDKTNGIIVDQSHSISAFMTEDGTFKQIPLVNFSGSWSPSNSSAMPSNEDYELIESLCERLRNQEFHDKWDGILDRYKDTVTDINKTNVQVEKNAKIDNYVNQHNLEPESVNQIIDYADNLRLKEYMLDNYPDLSSKVSLDSIDEFIQNLHMEGTDFDTASGLIDIINDVSDMSFI